MKKRNDQTDVRMHQTQFDVSSQDLSVKITMK